MHRAGFVGHKHCSNRLEADLIAILLRDSPLILDRGARLVLDRELLLGRNTDVAWWEEQLLVLECHLRSIAVALKQNLLHVCTGVVEQELGIKVVEAG